MNYWNVLKYGLMVLFFLIIVIGFALAVDTQEAQQSAPQTTQSKFNI